MHPSEPTAEPGSLLSTDSVSCITSSIADEQHERAKWQLNLIVHNVPESAKDDPIVRKNDDISEVNKLFQKHLNLKIAINNAVRIGKKDPSKLGY